MHAWRPLLAASLLALSLLAPASAQAHSELKSVSPVDGSTLAATPGQVVLTFTDDVLGDFTQVTVTGPDGIAVTLPAPVSTGPTVTQNLPPLANGLHTVAFRIVSADSHPIAGQSTFTVAVPESAAPSQSKETSAVPAGSTSSSAAPAQPSTNPTAVETTPDGTTTTTATVLLLTLAAALLGGFVWSARSHRRR